MKFLININQMFRSWRGLCAFCKDKAHTINNNTKLCYGCEHEIFYKHEEYGLLHTLYGDDY